MDTGSCKSTGVSGTEPGGGGVGPGQLDSNDRCNNLSRAVFTTSLNDTLKEKLNIVISELNHFEKTENDITGCLKEIDELRTRVDTLYVYGSDQDKAEKSCEELTQNTKELSSKTKQFVTTIKDYYLTSQEILPNDLQKLLTELELRMEQLVQSMDEKERQQKRARTVRQDYANHLENLTNWVQKAEIKVRDKTSQPQALKQSLQEIQSELPDMSDRLEKLVSNANVICDNSQDTDEVTLIRGNVNTLREQLITIRNWIDEKKQQIGDCLDSWDRFMTLYNTVMNWAREKQGFVDIPLVLENLADAKSRLHDYNVNVKSCRNMGKTLSEMSKELENISENGSVGDLSEKMEEAEAAKVEVEAKLLERNALLHETSEEWEQCEKKLREVKSWVEKTKGAVDSGAGKKKPLRDQLAAKEKIMTDVSVQKSKISVSVEKLQVHFKSGLQGGESVIEAAEKLKHELDSLHGIVRQQSTEIEAAIDQAEQYQQELLHLKQEVITSEQKLRTISSPAYLPHDRESAIREQNACKERVQVLESKISALTQRLKHLLQRGTPDLDPLMDI